MKEMYLITGVQLGMLIAIEDKEERKNFIMNDIISFQYVYLPNRIPIKNCILINKEINQNKIKRFK